MRRKNDVVFLIAKPCLYSLEKDSSKSEHLSQRIYYCPKHSYKDDLFELHHVHYHIH